MSGFVGTKSQRLDQLKSKVRPSQRINNDPHKVWFSVKKMAANISIATAAVLQVLLRLAIMI